MYTISSNLSHSQSSYSISMGMHTSYSWLGMNKQSGLYNDNWEQNFPTFRGKEGYGFMLGITKSINSQFAINFNPRLQKWGGIVYTENKTGSVFLELDIEYHSFRFPFSLQYTLLQRKRLTLSTMAGIGLDYTYYLRFLPANGYGQGNMQKRNVGIVCPFGLLGFKLSYKRSESSKFLYQAGCQLESDYLINPERFNDFGGFFNQVNIPLYGHMTSVTLSLDYQL